MHSSFQECFEVQLESFFTHLKSGDLAESALTVILDSVISEESLQQFFRHIDQEVSNCSFFVSNKDAIQAGALVPG
jgi:hypothetical protein